jgi:hypothetical protein
MVSISGAGVLMVIDRVPGPMDKSSDIDAREFQVKLSSLIQIKVQALKNGFFSYYPPSWGRYLASFTGKRQ